MRGELFSFTTEDQLNLSGIYFDAGQNKCVVWIHGSYSSVFYSAHRINTLAQVLNQSGISLLAFDNRGANHVVGYKKFENGKKYYQNYGTVYELIKDCVYDIDAAINFLNNKSVEEIYLAGHSTGANKVVVYDKYKQKNKVKKYILLGGGDDTGYFIEKYKDNFAEFIKQIELLAKEDPQQIVNESMSPIMLSAGSLFDMANLEGDYNIFPFYELATNKISKKELFGELKNINKETLLLYGELESHAYPNITEGINNLKNILKDKNNFNFEIIKQADHSFEGKEEEMARSVLSYVLDV